ncbi:MAG TPA: sigma-70 family RNA polymerase sigma factor [Firmicutes bacterium]|nr:sigma-70 family RNA polymerase sigma factor [Bacillota bacterium]
MPVHRASESRSASQTESRSTSHGTSHSASQTAIQSDAALVARARAGDEEAFSVIVSRYANAVFAVALSRVPQPFDAEDIAQEVFVKAYFQLGQLRDPGRIGAWLYRIARRMTVQWYRRESLQVVFLEDVPEAYRMGRPDCTVGDREEWIALRDCLLQLPVEARTILILRYVADWTEQQIAEFLDLPVGTVESRLSRARQRLKGMCAVVADGLKKQQLDRAFTRQVCELLAVKVIVGTTKLPDRPQLGLVYLQSEANKEKRLPFLLGSDQVQALVVALEGKTPPGPLSPHDILIRAVTELGGRIEKAVITACREKEDTYLAELHLEQNGRHIALPCQPGDAINVAARAGAPVYVARELINAAGPTVKEGVTSLDELPKGWFAAGSHPKDYSMGVDKHVTHEGNPSGYIRSKVSEPAGFGTMMQTFKADAFRGRRLRLSGYLKSENVEGWAGLWMRVDGPQRNTLSFDNMSNRPIVGTTGWTKYSLVLDVPESSLNIAFGILLAGRGQVWVAELQFDVVGDDVPTTDLLAGPQPLPSEPRNLDFTG